MDLNGKVILISGATGGMGKEIVKLLSKERSKLALFAEGKKNLKRYLTRSAIMVQNVYSKKVM